ncbi:glycosyltransferase [Paenibacillus prosopidis]|uniref:GT2 family glycosyltransferase n=1 Tax=Paenibacillus prosopidis TaxID=630520 RepID=A0A368VWZ1_9BACL|nr:glycosyltransferase [Paenibacillus prosopidis]RCW46452.1 GT2 family glycosyltransferase [Paenibacillus prosopidis]
MERSDLIDSLNFFLKQKTNLFLNNPSSCLELPVFEQSIISIILVVYNKAEYTFQCLETIMAYADVPYEIILIDNASTDETSVLLNKIKHAVVIKNNENVWFIRGCNQGALAASGKWLLFLNNDTQITPSLLSNLLETAQSTDRCGAVGGKLVFPNGKLQEAGSVIWNDGSCSGYGRGDDPLKPEYSYTREVDYCSGACLLVNKELFMQAGMFDEQYMPAYYEETDLCMKLRSMGYKVMYDPSAIIIHYEFGSSESDSEPIKMQIRNREKFVGKWKEHLSAYYSHLTGNSLLTREHGSAKKLRLLFVEDRIPNPELGSGFPRSYKLLELLSEYCQVTLFPLQIPQKREQPYTRLLQRKGIEVLFNTKEEKLDFRQFFISRKHYYHAVWISRPHNMMEIIFAIRMIDRNIKVIYDAEALFSFREILKLELQGNTLTKEDKNELIQKELDMIGRADEIVTVSENEKALLNQYGIDRVNVLGHCMEKIPTFNSFEQRQDILFVGGFLESPSPNEDAMLYFVREIYPMIHQLTGARLWIVGTNRLPSIQQLSSDSITVTGQVDRLWDYFNQCRVAIVPTRYAGGIPIKLLECLAHGLPPVVTPLIAKQLSLDEQVVLVGNDPEQFAQQVVRCYTDKQLWENLRNNGLNWVEQKYGPEQFKDVIRGIVESFVPSGRDINA